jgi:hypothetical protein
VDHDPLEPQDLEYSRFITTSYQWENLNDREWYSLDQPSVTINLDGTRGTSEYEIGDTVGFNAASIYGNNTASRMLWRSPCSSTLAQSTTGGSRLQPTDYAAISAGIAKPRLTCLSMARLLVLSLAVAVLV